MNQARFSFLVLLLTISSLQVNCKRYDLPQGWSVRNDAKLKEFEAAGGIGHYRLIPAPSSAKFLSDNGTYALSFFRFNGTRRYYLSIIIGASYRTKSSKVGAVVWTANRNRPISENGLLRLGSEGAVELVDFDAKVAWSFPGAVSGVEMQEVGNMIFYNATGTVWQSFNEPTDVLCDGQKLYYGRGLSSNMNSSTMARGYFQTNVALNGVGLYLSLPNEELEVYFEWNLWNQGNAQSLVPCPTYETVLQFNSSSINMFYEKNRTADENATGNFSKCGPDLSASLLGPRGSLNYLRLDETGNLLQFSFDPQQLIWNNTVTSVASQIGPCLPMACQSNSICRVNGGCDCLLSNAGSNTTCPAPVEQPLACNNLEAKNHHFMNVSGASYFSNKYSQADKVSTLEDCWDLCLSNCSCRAFFYENRTASCYFLRTLHGSLTTDATTTAFLKMQNSKLTYPQQQNHDIVIITGSVGGGTLLVLLFVGLVAFWLWRKHANEIAGTLAAALQGSLRRYSYRELQLATSKFSSEIGSGASGCVYEGVLDDGTKVAVKRLNNTSQGQKEFVTEVNSIGSVSHMNIVKMCGFCAEKSHRMLVYEFVANGSLDRWLFGEGKNEQGRVLEWKTRFGIALGVARALSYLHEESTQLIMHLDIKPQNILLDEQFVPKVCDFGVSKLVANREVSHATTNVRGTPGYLAPEWLLHSVATKKCDVYSYGMVLLELISGRKNFKEPSSNQQEEENEKQDEDFKWYYPAWAVSRMRQGKCAEILDGRIAGEAGEEEAERVIRVALWCIQENPMQRPAMENVVQMLEGRREAAEPPLEFHFAVPSSGIINICTRSKTSGGGGISISTMPTR